MLLVFENSCVLTSRFKDINLSMRKKKTEIQVEKKLILIFMNIFDFYKILKPIQTQYKCILLLHKLSIIFNYQFKLFR